MLHTDALRRLIALVAHTSTEVKNGDLFGYTDDLSNFGIQAALLADKILQRADSGTL